MKNDWTEGEYRVAVITIIFPYLFIGLIVFVGILKSCLETEEDPLDIGLLKSREIVKHLIVEDSTRNGFRVVYTTKCNVTEARLAEIRSRPHIEEAFSRLKREAPLHFGSLLEADIYDFAAFALKYDVDDDIVMHNIFVTGVEKCNHYIGPNPKIENPAEYFDFLTEQGTQYISHSDIYYYTNSDKRVYRYWKCNVINEMSETDERFSHFSEKERIR